MNEIQLQTVRRLIGWIKDLRGLEASVQGERQERGYVYFQLDVGTPNPFPELRLSDRGTLDSDTMCIGGAVRSYPTPGDLPTVVSLAFADECVAGLRKGQDQQWDDVRRRYVALREMQGELETAAR